MELNNWKTYLAIAIIGSTIGTLYAIIQRDRPVTLTIFFITLYFIVALKYILERQHYKKHNAILASSQFLILPFSVMLMGNYISPEAWAAEIFATTTNLSGGGTIEFFFNLISISLLIPSIIFLIFFSNFYSGKWPGMAINRKIKRGRTLPFLFHSLIVLTFLIGFFINGQIDFVCFIFVILYIVYIFRYFVYVAINKSRREVKVTTRRASTRTASSRASSSQRRGDVSVSSRNRQRSVSTRARVDPGIDVTTTRRRTKTTKTITTVSKSMFPIGTPKKEEMQCIICYMDFDKKDTRKIILCPNCKYPAHEDEFLNWFQKSRLCARCNQPISTRYVNNPKYRITIRIYIEKIIEKL